MLIGFGVVIAGIFAIAGTFLSIEARRAQATTHKDQRDSTGDWSVTQRSNPERE